MSEININDLVAGIVKESCELKNKHTDEINSPVNYACIFSQSDDELNKLKKYADQIGRVIEKTPSGPLYNYSMEFGHYQEVPRNVADEIIGESEKK